MINPLVPELCRLKVADDFKDENSRDFSHQSVSK